MDGQCEYEVDYGYNDPYGILTHWPLGGVAVICESIVNSLHITVALALPMKLHSAVFYLTTRPPV